MPANIHQPAGSYFHAFNRGVAGQAIFLSKDNYLYLTNLIHRFLPGYQLGLVAYCLMPNHYHFLFRVDGENQLSLFIQRLFNSYTQAFNRQNQRCGTLFESRVKLKIIEKETYATQLVRYIHLNPVKARLVKDPQDWPYCNYQEWIGVRNGKLYDSEVARLFFENGEDYRQFVQMGITPEEEERLAAYTLE